MLHMSSDKYKLKLEDFPVISYVVEFHLNTALGGYFAPPSRSYISELLAQLLQTAEVLHCRLRSQLVNSQTLA